MKPRPPAVVGPDNVTRRPFIKCIAGAQQSEPDAIRFHSHRISQGALLRGGCLVYPTHGLAILYIRARDSEVDMDALKGIAGALEMRLNPAGEISSVCSGIKARVSFHQTRAHAVYAVGAYNVPSNQLTAARRLVETIAAKLFELKEAPHFNDGASQRFRLELLNRTCYL
jgi:hypothetical protein